MSQENVELVRRALEALSRGGLDAAFEDVDPGAAYDLTATIGPYAGIYYGREVILGFLKEFFETWEHIDVQAVDIIEADGDRVVVPIHARLQGKESGVNVEARPTTIWTVHDGKIVRVAVFNDRAEALQAAGLSE